jgi:small nuclear ribonucleoprotein (snRNP)-like protein
LQKAPNLFDVLPENFHSDVFKWDIDFDVAIKYLKDVNSKILVSYECETCGENCQTEWSKILVRKNHRFSKLCYICLQRLINTSEDVLSDHKERSIKLWENPDYRSKCLKSFEEHNRLMQTDVEYSAKHRRRSRSVYGSILINGHNIRFDSGFELIFISRIKEECDVIRRCENAIAYGSHFYHPDFYLVYPSGKRVIAEIKGYYKNNITEKREAAIRYIQETGVADEYVLYDVDLLLAEGILSGLGGTNMWKQIKKIYEQESITFSDPEHRRIAEIGYRRFYKEKKNQKDNQVTL